MEQSLNLVQKEDVFSYNGNNLLNGNCGRVEKNVRIKSGDSASNTQKKGAVFIVFFSYIKPAHYS